MISMLTRRLLFALSLVAAVSFLSFVGFGLSLDPTYPLVLNPDQRPRHALQEMHHLNDPILTRYWLWLKAIPSHGFGSTVLPLGTRSVNAVETGTPISPQIWAGAKVTAQLLGASLLVTLVMAVGFGAWTALRRTPLTAAATFLAYAAWATPAFFLGALLLFIWPSVGGWFEFGPPRGPFLDWIRVMTLPTLTLSLGLVGLYGRFLRSAMRRAAAEPYAVVARAKGLSEAQIARRHLLRNSLIPMISVLALDIASIVGLSLAVDAMFGMGGLASTFLTALAAADPFDLTAVLVVLAVIVSVFIFLAEVVSALLDPRYG
jgi:peptide/nickel transport system permease protein